MKLDELIECALNLNEEEVYLVKKEMLDKLTTIERIDEFASIGEALKRLVKNLSEFATDKKDFSIALYKFRIGSIFKWSFYLLYRYYGKYYRVQLENNKCSKCGSINTIANPTLPNLFDTVKEERKLLDEIYQLPKVNCPHCNSMIDRYAIWAEIPPMPNKPKSLLF